MSQRTHEDRRTRAAGTPPVRPCACAPHAPARRRALRWLLLFGMLTLCTPAGAEPAAILVVLGDTSAPYQEVTGTLRERLRNTPLAGARLITTGWQEYARQAAGARPAATVAVGVKAMQTVLASRPSTPVICGLVPRRAFDLLLPGADAREPEPPWTALYLDQPLARQLELVRLVLPGRQRVGLLLGLESEAQLTELRALARERRITLHPQVVESADALAASLQRAAEAADVVWMLPDASISSAGSVRDVLLASYRHKRPVIGFSQGYVRAGALAAVYSTPTQVGQELAVMLIQALATPSRLPPPRYPALYEVALNYNVARSYGLQLDDEQTVLRKLRAQEAAP